MGAGRERGAGCGTAPPFPGLQGPLSREPPRGLGHLLRGVVTCCGRGHLLWGVATCYGAWSPATGGATHNRAGPPVVGGPPALGRGHPQ